MGFVVNAMLNVIMVVRLHAMYQRSRKMLIFLVITFTAVTVTQGVNSARGISSVVGMGVVLSSSLSTVINPYTCGTGLADPNSRQPIIETSILGITWEVLALCLTLWIVAKHVRELQRSSTGWTAGGCITVLMETHVRYFIAFAIVSCFSLGSLSPAMGSIEFPMGTKICNTILQVISFVQMFVLGPRLILSIREYHAKLVANSESATGMTLPTIAFQERTHITRLTISSGGVQ